MLIVGAGGTGGTLASMLARYLYSKKTDEIRQFKLYLIDGDLVDEKNINRQPFSSDDVGCFKVDCLSEAYTEVYGISVFPFPTYIDKVKKFENIVGSDWFGTSRFYDVKQHIILIGAVDNHRARQTMHKYFDSVSLNINTDIIYIDSANEFDFGTVVAGYRNFSGVQCPDRTFYFPDVLKSRAKKASQLSCGAINISAPQHYVTNQLAATITFYLLNLSIKSYGYEPIIDKEIYDIFKINDVDRLIEYFEEEFNVTITKKDMEKYDEFDLSGTFDCHTMNYIAFFIPTGKKISQEHIEIYVDDLTCGTIFPFRLNPSVLLVNAKHKWVQGIFLYLAWGVDEYDGDFVPLETLDFTGLLYSLLYIYRDEVLNLV